MLPEETLSFSSVMPSNLLSAFALRLNNRLRRTRRGENIYNLQSRGIQKLLPLHLSALRSIEHEHHIAVHRGAFLRNSNVGQNPLVNQQAAVRRVHGSDSVAEKLDALLVIPVVAYAAKQVDTSALDWLRSEEVVGYALYAFGW